MTMNKLLVRELLYSMYSSCPIAICFMSFVLYYVLINCFIFNLFIFCLFSCFVRFAFYFVLRVFVLFLMYIVVYFIYVYNFTDNCHRVDIQLQLINIISSYHIISE